MRERRCDSRSMGETQGKSGTKSSSSQTEQLVAIKESISPSPVSFALNLTGTSKSSSLEHTPTSPNTRTMHLSLSSLLASCLVVLVVVLSFMSGQAQSAPAPQEEGAGMRSALEYLQKLDQYYSQAARPRRSQERSRREDVASALMKLSQIRQHYSDLGRPRFGKRAMTSLPSEDYSLNAY